MALVDTLHPYYNLPSDVFIRAQDELIGYTRKTVSLTATAGTVVQIGTVLVDNDDGTASIPANAAALAAATKVCIFLGRDIVKTNYTLGNQQHNIAKFDAANLTQDIVVVWRGAVGVGKVNLILPSGFTNTQKNALYKLMEQVNGFKMLRQVGAYPFEQSFIQ